MSSWWSRGCALICMLVLACLPLRPAATGPGNHPFTVAAAADLQFAFTEMGQRFERRTGRKVIFSFGSTGNLARQIENGAPFDLFAAANVEFVDRLGRAGLLVPGTRQLYAIGHIVLASNRKAGAAVKDLQGLLDPRIRRVAIANPEHAPYGAAAREALMRTGVWEKLQPKLVLGENVRQTLQFIQTGNAEAGIVALSVANVPEITYKPIDARLHTPLRQAMAVVKGSPNETISREFIRFVRGVEGRRIMKRYGFASPMRNAECGMRNGDRTGIVGHSAFRIPHSALGRR